MESLFYSVKSSKRYGKVSMRVALEWGKAAAVRDDTVEHDRRCACISNPGVFSGKKRWLSRGWTTTSLHCLSRPRKLVDICHLRQTWFRCRRFSHVGNSTVVFWELLLRLHTVQGCFASVNWQSFTAATCVTLEMHAGTSRHQCQILFDSIQAEINYHFKVNWLNFKTLGYSWKTLPAPTDSGVHLIFHHLCMALFAANASQGDIAFLILHFQT